MLIVGLGNPGAEYESTRHNAGFMALDELAHYYGVSWRTNKKLKAQIIACDDFYMIKPLTFMNESGAAVLAVMSYYKMLPQLFGRTESAALDLSDKLVVIHDELDLPLGEYRISADSRSAGHKGVQSIIDHLKTKKFKRIRIGIAPAEMKLPAEKYVLNRFDKNELSMIKTEIKTIVAQLVKIK